MNLPLTPADTPRSLSDTQNMMANSAALLSHRTTQLQALLNASLTRHNKTLGASMPMLMSLAKLDHDTLSELLQLQNAINARFMEQNKQWFEGLQQIANEAGQLKKANTLSKFMEQQFDLVGQCVSLFSNQSTNLVSQLENIQIDIGYWITQKSEA